MVRRYITSYTHRRAFRQQQHPIADMTLGVRCAHTRPVAQPIRYKSRVVAVRGQNRASDDCEHIDR